MLTTDSKNGRRFPALVGEYDGTPDDEVVNDMGHDVHLMSPLPRSTFQLTLLHLLSRAGVGQVKGILGAPAGASTVC